MGSEKEVWKGMEARVMWCGVDEECKGRGKERCALLISSTIWEGIEGHRWKGSMIV